MKTAFNSRTATKIKDGRVQPKNRNRPTGHEGYVIDRESAGRGYRHVVTKQDLQAFIDIIPEWSRFSERLERIVLADANQRADGSHHFYHKEETGVIFLNAWSTERWLDLRQSYFDAHKVLLERLGVTFSSHKSGVICHYTEAQARAFMLLHVFMHELGHHFDSIHQKHRRTTKGEDYAEEFANSRFEALFPRYISVFGDPRNGANEPKKKAVVY